MFVTGATRFIGFAIVMELLGAGHRVTGLARFQEPGRRLTDAGAQVQIGTVKDLEILRRAAEHSDYFIA